MKSRTLPVGHLFLLNDHIISVSTGLKSQKVPVQKMVRIDSSDPAGRLHAYLHPKSHDEQEKRNSLTAVR